jgi:hypothetical protein
MPMEPNEWPLVRDHGYKILVLVGDPYSYFCRRFCEKHALLRKYCRDDLAAGSIEQLNVNLAPFEADRKSAPYEADIRKYNRHHMSFQCYDLEALNEHLKTRQPDGPFSDGPITNSIGQRFLLFNYTDFLMVPELLLAAHSIVLVSASESLLFEAFATTHSDGLTYYERCVHPGMQVSALACDVRQQ